MLRVIAVVVLCSVVCMGVEADVYYKKYGKKAAEWVSADSMDFCPAQGTTDSCRQCNRKCIRLSEDVCAPTLINMRKGQVYTCGFQRCQCDCNESDRDGQLNCGAEKKILMTKRRTSHNNDDDDDESETNSPPKTETENTGGKCHNIMWKIGRKNWIEDIEDEYRRCPKEGTDDEGCVCTDGNEPCFNLHPQLMTDRCDRDEETDNQYNCKFKECRCSCPERTNWRGTLKCNGERLKITAKVVENRKCRGVTGKNYANNPTEFLGNNAKPGKCEIFWISPVDGTKLPFDQFKCQDEKEDDFCKCAKKNRPFCFNVTENAALDCSEQGNDFLCQVPILYCDCTRRNTQGDKVNVRFSSRGCTDTFTREHLAVLLGVNIKDGQPGGNSRTMLIGGLTLGAIVICLIMLVVALKQKGRHDSRRHEMSPMH